MVVHINGYEIAVARIAEDRFDCRLRRRGESQWPKVGLTFPSTHSFDRVYRMLLAMTEGKEEAP